MSDPGELVLGIDCSTTACKAIAWDMHGRAYAEGRAPIALYNPSVEAYEQDARDYWTATATALRQLRTDLNEHERSRIRAVCVTHQRETFVLTDAAGEPVLPALVWMDTRCKAQVERAVERFGAGTLHRITGKPACTTPSFYKLLGLLEAHPQTARTRPQLCDVHAYLVRQLTGEFTTSLASADPTGLVDMALGHWSTELLDYLGFELDQLPALALPGTLIGHVSARAAAECGLPAGLPVFAGAGDGQAAGLGAGVLDESSAYLNLGTAIVSGVLSRGYHIDPAFRTLYAASPGAYFMESDLKGGTFILNWFAEKFLGQGNAAPVLARLEHEAVKLPPGSHGLLLVPYWNGVMNPYWDDDATGVTIGWRGTHTPPHFYRAVLEGIAFEQRLASSGIERAAGKRTERYIVMGGGSMSKLWCQMLADVLGRPVDKAATQEATALGAGILAATGAGLYPDLASATQAMTRTEPGFQPGPDQTRYEELYAAYTRIYPALRTISSELARLTRAR